MFAVELPLSRTSRMDTEPETEHIRNGVEA